jgi:two-component system, OmpR family, copper resistance phosphate regulon response regulator CusR
MKILIVEDEQKTLRYLQKGLMEQGYLVNTADNGEDGLHLGLNIEHDLIVLDVMLPKLSGWTIIEKLRNANVLTPVLFLTARDETHDRVKGLELGADDYLVKPFAFSELLARTKAITRRGQKVASNELTIDSLKIDLKQQKAWRDKTRIMLSKKEFSLLAFFLQRPGDILSRTLIAEHVWDMNFDSDTNVVDVAIKRLRQKIDLDGANKLIHTIRGMGYVLELRND